jgi:hypothetical protein
MEFDLEIREILYLEQEDHFRGRVVLRGKLLSGTVRVYDEIYVPRSDGSFWHTSVGFIDLDGKANMVDSAMAPTELNIGIHQLPRTRSLVTGTIRGKSSSE